MEPYKVSGRPAAEYSEVVGWETWILDSGQIILKALILLQETALFSIGGGP